MTYLAILLMYAHNKIAAFSPFSVVIAPFIVILKSVMMPHQP